MFGVGPGVGFEFGPARNGAGALVNVRASARAAESKSILKAIDALGPERVSFGSDSPFGLMHVELARFEALLRDADERTRDLVMGDSIARVLGV